ncbi:hypothetical protein [Streptomyces sp. NPDC055085]
MSRQEQKRLPDVESRELWERNALLAEAFCSTDDQVRDAQTVMDEAVAGRTRALAAFAVTVGSDGAVADLLGLNEREVRVARRTVGKEDARVIADQLLTAPGEIAAPPAPPTPTEATLPTPPPTLVESRTDQQAEPARIPLPRPRMETAPAWQPPGAEHAQTAPGVNWTAGMDSVLLWSWESGLDLQTVAQELGLSSKELLLRAQALAGQGRLGPQEAAYERDQSGRHRRHDIHHTFVPDSPEGLYMASPYT